MAVKKSTKQAKQNTSASKGVRSSISAVTAKQFIEKLKTFQSDTELKKIQRYFKSGEGEYGEGDKFMGVKMGQLFALAKEFELFGGVGVGMTPKFQKVDTFDYALNIETADATLDEGKKSYNSVNFDVGLGKDFKNNWKVGAVIKNLIPKKLQT